MIWEKISLRTRIYLILTPLVLITLVGGAVMIWYTYQMEGILSDVIDRNVAALQAAEALENALVNQKGFVTYYFLDGDPEWLRQLDEYRRIFEKRLHEVRSLAEDQRQRSAINQIESQYIQYITEKDQVIAHYKAGEREAGARLHRAVRQRFSKTLQLCEEYKALHAKGVQEERQRSHARAEQIRILAGSAITVVLFLGILLAFFLVTYILMPVRRLAMDADREGGASKAGDEVKALDQTVRGLIKDMDHTRSELERSREHLLQAEKMALVGKLAAGVAHSIRNPLTSVKMRLFSLGRSLDLTSIQKEDFYVISEEIRHIDTIVQNFLEFSRPPKLKMQRISPSDIVDMALQLLKHRLESYGVEIALRRQRVLSAVMADPEQLKEVLVNIIVNACESMEGDGLIEIFEEEGHTAALGRVVVLKLKDNGPGIPEAIRDRIFQPFFTTKEEGSGLGLSIAARIVEEHGAWLDLISKEGEGSTFVITIPISPVYGIQGNTG